MRARLIPTGLSVLCAASVLCWLAASPTPDAAAQTRVVPSSPADVRLSFAPIVGRTAPAVVTVSAAKVVANRNPLMDDPFFRRFFGREFGEPREARSLGSGVIVDASGLVVTNNHVVDGADQVKISLGDRREFDVDVVLKDARTDLAILRIRDTRGERFPVLEFGNSDEMQVGDMVLAIGNPFGVGQTVTHGIVSALARTQVGISDFQFFIQTDAAINPGNSGGPLVDMSGRIVGINTAIFSRSGGSQGVGFAIPANMVRVVVASAMTGGTAVKRPWLGAKLQAVTADIAEKFGLKRPAGAVVTNVTPASPAARAGLKTGDVIVSVDNQAVDDPNAFDYRFVTRPLGGQAQLGVVRAGRETKVAIALETAPEVPLEELTIRARSPFQGLKIVNLTTRLAEQLRVGSSVEGVVVVDVADGALAERYGFQRGDLVIAVNNESVARTRDLERLAQGSARRWSVTIMRGGQQITAELGG